MLFAVPWSLEFKPLSITNVILTPLYVLTLSLMALLMYTLYPSSTELFVVLWTCYFLSAGKHFIWQAPNYLPSLRSNGAPPHAPHQAFPAFLKQIYITECLAIIIQRRQWHPTPVLLPGKSHGQRSLVGFSPWGRWGSDMTEWLHFHFSLSCIGEGNGNPLQCSCLKNPRDWGTCWAAIYGVTQSRTRLKRLSSSYNHYVRYFICFHSTLYLLVV